MTACRSQRLRHFGCANEKWTLTPALLLRDELENVYQRERAKVLATHPERAMVGRAHASVLECIQNLASTRHAVGASEAAKNGHSQLPPLPQTPAQTASALQEDFVILNHEADTLRTEYLQFGLHVGAHEKVGLDFAAIHAPWPTASRCAAGRT